MNQFVYDSGVLVAADRNDPRIWADHRARLKLGLIPIIPAPVVAQVSRSARQANLRRLLAGCTIAPLTESDAHEAGRLLGLTKTSDVVDAVVVTVAARSQAVILTGDMDDMARLIAVSGSSVSVEKL